MNGAQLNIRVNRDLKTSGEAGLAAAGYTSSEAFRAILNFASEHAREPQVINKLMSSLNDSKDNAQKNSVNPWEDWNLKAHPFYEKVDLDEKNLNAITDEDLETLAESDLEAKFLS